MNFNTAILLIGLSITTVALAGPDKNEEIKTKLKSKECQIYRVEKDICQKSYVEAAADTAMELEKEATKQSGIVNKSGRYKAGEMKAMHGTSKIGKLKTTYKKLAGKDWSSKSCESGKEDDGTDETKACGCIQEGNFADCPLN